MMAAVLVGAALVAPATHAQSSPHAGLLEQAGWTALEAGQLRAAADAFEKAAAADPKNARAHLGVALVAFAERRDEDAVAAADRTLALAPTDRRARELRGRLLYRQGDLTHAIATLDTLVVERPDPLLVETLHRWRREADLRDRSFSTGGGGFSVTYEGPDDEALAGEVLAAIERAAARIDGVLSHNRTTPIAIVLYTNEQFRDITRSPAWAAGAFDGIIRIPMRGALARPEELERVLAHEYVHAVVHDLAQRRVPVWLNEGLAEALEREAPATTGSPAVALDTLDRPFHRLSADAARRAYAASAHAVRRLLDTVGGFAVTTLLRDLGDGVDFEEAFARRMHQTVGEFEAKLRGGGG